METVDRFFRVTIGQKSRLMARILYCHPSRTRYGYHIFTDLDFWDALRTLRDLATVKRNFGPEPPGDEFPTQVVATGLDQNAIAKLEHRVKRAIVSPPRHVIVRSVIMDGFFEFDPSRYYPKRWPESRILHFTTHRLPLEQSVLNSPHKTVMLSWVNGKLRVETVRRKEKYDPIIRNRKEASRRLKSPSCF